MPLDIFSKAFRFISRAGYLWWAEPSWEVNFYWLKIPSDSLEPGFCLEEPDQEEDIGREHQPTMDNKMMVIEVDGERLKIRLSWVTEDVNYFTVHF